MPFPYTASLNYERLKNYNISLLSTKGWLPFFVTTTNSVSTPKLHRSGVILGPLLSIDLCAISGITPNSLYAFHMVISDPYTKPRRGLHIGGVQVTSNPYAKPGRGLRHGGILCVCVCVCVDTGDTLVWKYPSTLSGTLISDTY